GVVYDGSWVGEKSPIPNVGGIRKALVDALKGLGAPVIRYPGGCFADSYDWRDGVGDRAKRPRRTNFWVGVAPDSVPANSIARVEPNFFGTNEFMRFCSLTGAKPYLAANLRGLGAQVFNEWYEYCNAPAGSTTLAQLRNSGPMPSVEPFGVEFWGIGNESWGCGGNLTPEEYSQEYRRFTAAVPGYKIPHKFVGSGASSDDLNWTRGFFSNMRAKGEGMFGRVHGWGLHHYAWNTSGGRTNDWDAGKGDAVKFSNEQYYELLAVADRVNRAIDDHWAVMGEFDTKHRVKILVDEWGAWHRPGAELKPEYLLGQQNTMRDALLAALTLDIFNRQADKVSMANIAQLVNCLQSLFLTDGDKFLTTPTYHVFEMFKPHMGAQSVRAVFNAPKIGYERNGKAAQFWGLNGSASINGKDLTLTVTNPNLTETVEAKITIRGARVTSARARVLMTGDVHEHNTFTEPNAVKPYDTPIETDATSFRFGPASVTALQLTLG
ncbi:MAG: alpha-L-arabinofuranosidase C-terminal domain-containing protein, partial [Pyrinomonadaceae bacterium]